MTIARSDAPIETERLLIRRVTAADLPFFEGIHADPEVARYLSHGRPRTAAESKEWIETLLESYEQTGLGQCAVTLKADGTLIGRCGLSFMAVDPTPRADGLKTGYYFPAKAPPGVGATGHAELGYTLDRAQWGKGYAREAVAAIYEYSTRRLQRKGIISLIHADNARSKRLADSFGVSYVDKVLLWDRAFNRYLWP